MDRDLEIYKNTVRKTIHAGEWIASKVYKIDIAAVGAIILDMDKDSTGVYHANYDCWQDRFGYNDAYDFVFDIGTSIAKEKFDFVSGGQDFTIWVWKGDYINLGAGAEMGIYKKLVIAGYDTPQWVVDKNLAMTMSLNLKDNTGKTIINYTPSEKQWWITGFNPAYKNVEASNLTATYSLTFNDSTMYSDFYNKFGDENSKNYDSRWTDWDSGTFSATLKF